MLTSRSALHPLAASRPNAVRHLCDTATPGCVIFPAQPGVAVSPRFAGVVAASLSRHGGVKPPLRRIDRNEFRRLDVQLLVGAVVKLEVLPWGERADSPHGPDGLSSTCKKSLREIADFKGPKSVPAGVRK